MDTETYDIIPENESDNQEENPKRLTYWIHIPQLGFKHYGYESKVDLTDGLILSHIYYFHLNPEDNERVKYITKNGSRYVRINYKYIIDANPLLHIRYKSAISKRIKKLRELGLINTQQAPENTLYVEPTQLLIDIFNYRVESTKKREKDMVGVSYEATGCYSQKEQGVIPEDNSTISNKISNKINNNIYVESKNDSTYSIKKMLNQLRDKQKNKKEENVIKYPLGLSKESFEFINKKDLSEEERQILKTYLTNKFKNKDKLTDIKGLNEIISQYTVATLPP